MSSARRPRTSRLPSVVTARARRIGRFATCSSRILMRKACDVEVRGLETSLDCSCRLSIVNGNGSECWKSVFVPPCRLQVASKAWVDKGERLLQVQKIVSWRGSASWSVLSPLENLTPFDH